MQTRTAELSRSMSEACWASVTRVLGGRPVSFVLKELVAPRNYVALARMSRVCERPLDVARRYLPRRRRLPFVCGVRTPLGVVRPTLYTHHDVWTLSEIFCREDYRAGPETTVVVDIGSNIGLSGLYFLTRNRELSLLPLRARPAQRQASPAEPLRARRPLVARGGGRRTDERRRLVRAGADRALRRRWRLDAGHDRSPLPRRSTTCSTTCWPERRDRRAQDRHRRPRGADRRGDPA